MVMVKKRKRRGTIHYIQQYFETVLRKFLQKNKKAGGHEII